MCIRDRPEKGGRELYMAEIKVYANNRTGLLVDISKILTERKIDVSSMNSRTSKQGTATIALSFDVPSKMCIRDRCWNI